MLVWLVVARPSRRRLVHRGASLLSSCAIAISPPLRKVSNNLIFNQCRESGDHGPMNSWDRNAFLSDVYNEDAGGAPSYTAKMNHVRNNMIIANYGSSQGFDTDDGSSWCARSLARSLVLVRWLWWWSS